LNNLTFINNFCFNVKFVFSSKKFFLKTHNMAWNIQIAEICSVSFDVHAQFAFKAAHMDASYSFHSNHIDLKNGTFYIKSFLHQQLCLKCIFNFFKNSMIIFEFYKTLSEWVQSAPPPVDKVHAPQGKILDPPLIWGIVVKKHYNKMCLQCTVQAASIEITCFQLRLLLASNTL